VHLPAEVRFNAVLAVAEMTVPARRWLQKQPSFSDLR
jgi:hypothetical protein